MKSNFKKTILLMSVLSGYAFGAVVGKEIETKISQVSIDGNNVDLTCVGDGSISISRIWTKGEPSDTPAMKELVKKVTSAAKDLKNCKLHGPEDKNPLEINSIKGGELPVENCKQASLDWVNSKEIKDYKSSAGTLFLVYDDKGHKCFQSYYSKNDTKGTRINKAAVGDNIIIGSYNGNLDFSLDPCDLLSSQRPIEKNYEKGVSLESGIKAAPEVYRCENKEITITIKNDKESLNSEIIKQYERYRGTFQVGVIWSKFNDDSYSTFDYGEGAVIRSEVGVAKHPEYTGSFVLYGAPHYLDTLGGGSYFGRDTVNENEWKDRIGLAFNFGLTNPKDLLGVGISFELATGISLTYSRLWKKVNQLDGYKLGDKFSGAANTIPTIKNWQHENVVGISIDGRYLAEFFSGDKK